MTFDDVVAWVRTAKREDLDRLSQYTKLRRDAIGIEQGLTFMPGSRVWFDAKRRGIVYGKFVDLKRKNATVLSDDGMRWTVAPQLLHHDTRVVAP